jgi:malonyl-CoA O-methyltransferase
MAPPRKSRSIKNYVERITNSVIFFAYKLSKIATGKSTTEIIYGIEQYILRRRTQELAKETERLTTRRLYSLWAKNYDHNESNLIMFLEKQQAASFLGNLEGKAVLDLGCGTGRYAISLAKQGAKVTAVDFSPAMLAIASAKAAEAKATITFEECEITRYKPTRKFDAVLCSLVLDHVRDLDRAIDVIAASSRRATRVVITNMHPEVIRRNELAPGNSAGFLYEPYRTRQFVHPLEEYVSLFFGKGFILAGVKELTFERKYQRLARFRGSGTFKGKPVGVMMCFTRWR